MNTMVCMVLPKPISSANIVSVPWEERLRFTEVMQVIIEEKWYDMLTWVQENLNQFKPSSWYSCRDKPRSVINEGCSSYFSEGCKKNFVLYKINFWEKKKRFLSYIWTFIFLLVFAPLFLLTATITWPFDCFSGIARRYNRPQKLSGH